MEGTFYYDQSMYDTCYGPLLVSLAANCIASVPDFDSLKHKVTYKRCQQLCREPLLWNMKSDSTGETITREEQTVKSTTDLGSKNRKQGPRDLTHASAIVPAGAVQLE